MALPGDFIDFSTDAEVFDLGQYLSEATGGHPELLDFPDGRKALTRKNALLWAVVYFRHWLRSEDTNDKITFSDFHLSIYRWASQDWLLPLGEPKKFRDAILGPRGIGKTTTLKILCLWALLHGHFKFLAVFSGSEDQSRLLIDSLTEELRTNLLLRADFPEHAKSYGKLPAELRALEQDRVDFFRTRGGAVIVARSVTASVAGLNVSGRRPDAIVLDDIEQVGENYTATRAQQRLATVLQSILPLRLTARVIFLGTAQLTASVMHEAVRSVEQVKSNGITISKPVAADAPDWLKSLNVTVRWFRPLVTRPDGSRRSIWPAMWSSAFLLDLEKSDPREYGETFDNSPWVSSGVFWSREYFTYGSLESASFTVLSVDPARNAKAESDYTGIAVVSYSKAVDKFEVKHAEQARVTGNQLRAKVLALLETYSDITSIVVEVNTDVAFASDAGIFNDIPVPVVPVRQTLPKPVRYEQAAIEWHHGRVLHTQRHPLLEGMLIAYPNIAHDDLTDACVTAVCEIRKRVRESQAPRPLSAVAARSSYAGFYRR
ncbi:hypothetical protein ACIBSW_34520 [Actinoplanes sp. NPDC049668]|uniref:hypothetical protein n=1 Tax=unclassified Actinoplanes TaxID=2626549 RepID=UPI0033B42D18